MVHSCACVKAAALRLRAVKFIRSGCKVAHIPIGGWADIVDASGGHHASLATSMNADNAQMEPGKYQLTATRGAVERLRQSFADLDDANQAVAEALVRYPDCGVRLTQGCTVLVSVAPSRSPVGGLREG